MAVQVLICDDSSFARKQMARCLPAGWDIEIHQAANGREGLEAIRAGRGELVFLDLNMPVMDGYEVLRTIRREDLPALVIVVSGDVQEEARRQVLRDGALAFVRKPIDAERIAAVLREFGLADIDPEAAGAAPPRPAAAIEVQEAYQEIANIAMGRAADLLARLLGTFVTLHTPTVQALDAEAVAREIQALRGQPTRTTILQGFIGDGIAGEALLTYEHARIDEIARLLGLVGKPSPAEARELLSDLGAILVGACLKGIADQLDVSFSQNHPVILRSGGTPPRGQEGALSIELPYALAEGELGCHLRLLFREDSVPRLDERISYLVA